jgi:hypothetical protein
MSSGFSPAAQHAAGQATDAAIIRIYKILFDFILIIISRKAAKSQSKKILVPKLRLVTTYTPIFFASSRLSEELYLPILIHFFRPV